LTHTAWKDSARSTEFDRPTGFIELLRFERLLSDFFARPVDLVTEPGLDPFIRESVVMSAAMLFDAAA
jgi:predicted nucleotidyltransferase